MSKKNADELPDQEQSVKNYFPLPKKYEPSKVEMLSIREERLEMLRETLSKKTRRAFRKDENWATI